LVRLTGRINTARGSDGNVVFIIVANLLRVHDNSQLLELRSLLIKVMRQRPTSGFVCFCVRDTAANLGQYWAVFSLEQGLTVSFIVVFAALRHVSGSQEKRVPGWPVFFHAETRSAAFAYS